MSKKPKHSARKHARRFAPSSSDRWMPCPGSIDLIGEEKDESTSEPAERGTAAHELLNVCVSTGKPPLKFKGQKFNVKSPLGPFVADNAMCNAVEYAVDYIRSRKPTKVWSEQELDIPATGEQGHVDVAMLYDNVLEVLDYKNGVVPVEVRDNNQMRLYVLGVLEALSKTELGRTLLKKVKRVRITVVQPNAYHVEGPVRSHMYRLEALRVFDGEVRQIVREVEAGSARLAAGPQCKYCPARARCETFAKHVHAEAKQDFAKVLTGKPEPKKPSLMTNAQLGQMFSALPLLEEWIKAVRERVAQLLVKDPEAVPGVKLVAGRSQRYWRDPEETMKAFKRLGYKPDLYAPRKLVGIGDAENLLDSLIRSEVMGALTALTNPPIHPVPETDPRPRAGSDAKVDFAEHLL